MIKSGVLWDKLKKYSDKKYIMCCSMSRPDESGSKSFEADSGSGILLNHAYSILRLAEVGPLKLVKVRVCVWEGGEQVNVCVCVCVCVCVSVSVCLCV